MARLTSLPSLLAPLAAPVRTSPKAEARAPLARQRDNAPWRAWYKTKRWRDLRQQVLVRDNYTCARTGIICSGRYPAPDSPVVNHKQPHRGSEAVFWAIDNLETVSKAIHDSAIQREEQASLHHRGIWD